MVLCNCKENLALERMMQDMDKKEILSRAQKEGKNGIDEGSIQVKNRGLRYGVNIVYLLYLFYLILAWMKDQSLPFVAQSMFMALVAGDFLSRWKDKHTVGSMILFILSIIATVSATVVGVVQLLGIC